MVLTRIWDQLKYHDCFPYDLRRSRIVSSPYMDVQQRIKVSVMIDCPYHTIVWCVTYSVSSHYLTNCLCPTKDNQGQFESNYKYRKEDAL